MSKASTMSLLLAVAAAFLACQGCGEITGPSFPAVASPRVIITTPSSPASDKITIRFQLIDREKESGSVTVEYSTDGGQAFQAVTLTDPADATNLTSEWHPGIIHTVQWDSVTDMVGISGDAQVCVKVTPSDASNPSGTADTTGTFTVDNLAFNQRPGVTVNTPAGVQSGNVQITYTLTDTEGDTCSIIVEFSIDGAAYQTATMGPAGDGTSGLPSSPGGTQHLFLWDSRTDNVGLTAQQNNVRIRITPRDFHTGTAVATNPFSVDNSVPNNPPTVSITSGPANGSTIYTDSVTFTWSGNDTDGSISGYYYSFDKNPPDVWTTSTSVTSGILTQGSHTFRVVAMDNDGDFSTVVSRTFTVSIAGTIEANFSASPLSGTAPLAVQFTNESSSTSGITSWSWGFGDGGTSGAWEPSHTYNSAGTYTVTLTVSGPDGSDTETKTNHITATSAGGDTWVRGTADCDFGPDDGNLKLIFEDNKIKLAPEGDNFGSAFDTTKWTKSESNCAISETGGEIIVDRIGSAAGGGVIDRDASSVRFADADIAAEASYLDPAIKSYGAFFRLTLTRDTSNEVLVAYKVRGVDHPLVVYKRINGVISELYIGPYIGSQSKLRLALRRDSSNNQFTAYYSTWNVGLSQWNAWTQYWQGIINDPTYFNTSHTLYPRIQSCWAATTDDFDFKFNEYWQRTDVIPAQWFWNDSPECDIIDSGAGSPEYCLDAGAGNTWLLSAFSAVASEPGSSSVKFKAGWGDSASRASATWINSGNWLTAAQLNAQVVSGALDGHRYVFLKAQFNSDGTDQPTLTSVTFTGTAGDVTYTASAFDTSPALDDNNQKVDVEGGIAKLQPWSEEVGNVFDAVHLKTTIQGGPNSALAEVGGVWECVAEYSGSIGSGSAFVQIWDGASDKFIPLGDLSVECEWMSVTAGGDTRCYLYILVDSSNWIYIKYQRTTKRFVVRVYKGGAVMLDDYSAVIDVTNFKMKISCVSDRYTASYNIGAGWVDVITDQGPWDLGSPAGLSACVSRYDAGISTGDMNYLRADLTDYYWNDSPEIYVVDHAGVDWAFDAGAGKVWQLSGASCVKTEPGTSSVEFKVGRSNTGNISDVAWADGIWKTAAQVSAKAAAGDYDGYRYIHVKAQFNSGGTDQPTLTSFSVTGQKVTP